MHYIQRIFILITLVLTFIAVLSCNHASDTQSNTATERSEHSESRSDSESGNGGEDDEEYGTQLTIDQTYNQVRYGARLKMSYDKTSKSFKGTVTNTTDDILKQVRVEVHLSNGTELGPTAPVDMVAGKVIEVTLTAKDEVFNSWSAHPEVGEDTGSEHGEDDEEYGEDDEEYGEDDEEYGE